MKTFLRAHRADVLLVLVLLVLSFAVMGLALCLRTPGGVAVIRVGDAEYGRYPLSEDREIRVTLPEGGYNVIVIRDGRVSVSDADCPDRLCVRTPAARFRHQTVICLPHRVTVTVEGGEEGADMVLSFVGEGGDRP